MAKHKGYTITLVSERSFDSVLQEVTVKSYKVSLGEKVIAVGMPTREAAERKIDGRHRARTRAGLDPVG